MSKYRHFSAIRKEEVSSTIRNNITTTDSVSGALQSSISLSNVLPQHSGTIGVGYSVEGEGNCNVHYIMV